MAKLFGTIEETEINDLPEAVQNALKAASANADTTTALQTKVTELTTALEDVKKNGVPTPVVVQAQTEAQKWGVSDSDLMLFETRKDVILNKFRMSADPYVASAVKLFENEISENLNKSAPSQRAMEAYVLNIVDLVKGRHMKEIMDDIRGNGGKFNSFFTESGSNNTPPAPTVTKAVDRLTAEQKKVADMYGIPYDKYAEQLQEVGGFNT